MDAVTLRQYETLSPFEIKNDLAKVATQDRQGLAGRLPERRARQSELDRDRAALGVLPARTIRHHREPAHDAAACRRRRNAEGAGDRRAARRLARRACRHARRRAPARGHSLGGEDLRFQRRRLRARAGRLDHRRQLPGAGSHARAQRADRSRVPGSGRCAASRGRPEPSASTRSRAARRRCATSSSRSRRTGCSTPATRSRW